MKKGFYFEKRHNDKEFFLIEILPCLSIESSTGYIDISLSWATFQIGWFNEIKRPDIKAKK